MSIFFDNDHVLSCKHYIAVCAFCIYFDLMIEGDFAISESDMTIFEEHLKVVHGLVR